MNMKIFEIYLNKLKQSQLYASLLDELIYRVYYIYDEYKVKSIDELILYEETKNAYIDNEWNYSLPINYTHKFMNENEKEYYKNTYVYRKYMYYERASYGNMKHRFQDFPHHYPEFIAIEFLKNKLNHLYQNYKNKRQFINNNHFCNIIKKWLYSYDADNLKHDIIHIPNITLVGLLDYPLLILEYYQTIEDDYNQRTKKKLCNWKLIDDTKKRFNWLIKVTRKKHKLSTYIWQDIYYYLF